MNMRFVWLSAYLFCAALSCYLTTTSLSVIFPAMNILVIWGLAIVIYVIASMGFALMVEGYFKSHVLSHPKLMLWGGLVFFLIAWGISLPTNTHTPIYQWSVGDVVTEDLETTKIYSIQLRDKKNADLSRKAEYDSLSTVIYNKFNKFQSQVATGISDNSSDGKSGFGRFANQYITEINSLLDKYDNADEYKLVAPNATNKASKTELIDLLNDYEVKELNPKLEKLKKYMLYVSDEAAQKAERHVNNIDSMISVINALKVKGTISNDSNVKIIKNTSDMLKEAYNNIKANEKFVRFNNNQDKKLYTSSNGETKTYRLFNPFAAFCDLFSGKTPSYIFLYLIIAVVIDMAAFIFFSKLF